MSGNVERGDESEYEIETALGEIASLRRATEMRNKHQYS
jgi:hypothetical protein